MRFPLLCALLIGAVACGGGSGSSNAVPRVIPVLPGVNVTVEEGVAILVQWLATDLDDMAVVDVFADIDGDLATTGDQIALALGVTELNGVQQEVTWDTAGDPFGVYNVIYRIDDGINAPVRVFAPGTVNLVPNPPPTAEIRFPPPNTATEATQITVTGRSDDVTGTRSVRVNGVVASTTDKFKTWQAVVDLMPDQVNVITVATEDELVNRDPAAATLFVDTRVGQPVGSGVPFGALVGAAFDEIERRVITLDTRLIAVDLESGVRTLFSGGGPAFQDPVSVRLDAQRDRGFVLDNALRAVVRIDLITGDRLIISDDARGTGPTLADPRAIVYDEDVNSLVVLDAPGTLYRIDIATGDRTVISGSGVGPGPDLVDPVGLEVDTLRRVAYVTDRDLDAVVAVDFVGGQRTILSALGTGAGITFQEPGGISIDLARNRVLIADSMRAAIIGVNLFTGDRTVASGPADARGTLLVNPVDICVDPIGGVMYVADPGAAAIFAVELVRGDRVVASR